MKGPEKDLNKTVTILIYPSIYLSIWISSRYVESRLVHQEQVVAPVISLTWWQSPDSGRLYMKVGLSCSFGCMLSESTPLVEFVWVGDWWAVIPTSPFATLFVFKLTAALTADLCLQQPGKTHGSKLNTTVLLSTCYWFPITSLVQEGSTAITDIGA